MVWSEDTIFKEDMVFFILCLLKDGLHNPALRLSWNHSMGTPQSMGKGQSYVFEWEDKDDLRHIF